jgi:uncharacterized membrane protein YgcG
MKRQPRLRVPPASVLGLLLLLTTVLRPAATAQPTFVVDEAHLFSQNAIRRAEERLRLIHERTGKTVRIVTLETLPAGTTLDGEAQRRFRAERINGVLVLIARRERGIAVRVGRYTAQVFGAQERRALLDLLRRRFRAGEYDAGLREAVAFMERVLTSAAPERSTPAPASGPRWNWLVPILLAMGGALVLGLILRRLSESQAPPAQEGAPAVPQPTASPWGGFLGGVLGGLFGSWLGHVLWGPRGIEGPPPSPPSPTWQTDDTLAPEGDVGESVTWDDAGADLPDTGDVDSGQW